MFLIDIAKEIAWLFLEMAPYLMIGLIFVGLLNMLVTKEMLTRHVGKKNFWSVLKASLLGVPLPLCSCGVVPTAVYMSKGGATKGSTVSFLVSTPQTGVDSILATYGMMGWVFAIFRPIAAFIMGIFSGSFIEAVTKKEKKLPTLQAQTYNYSPGGNGNPQAADSCDDDCCEPDMSQQKSLKDKVQASGKYAFVNFLDDISVHFLIGLAISGVIAFFIPEGFFTNSAFSDGILGMLLMIVIGAPMYVCATASIPIAVTLLLKGFSPGLAFVYLAVGPATNAASFTVIMNALGKKTAFMYLGIIAVSAIAFGYLLDFIFSYFNMDPVALVKHTTGHAMLINKEFQLVLGSIFFILLMMSLFRKIKGKFFKEEETMAEQDRQKIEIEGMSCSHCVETVRSAITKVPGVEKADVKLNENAAYVEGDYDISQVKKEIDSVGYKVLN